MPSVVIGYRRDPLDRLDDADGESLPVRLARQIRELPREPDDPRYTARTMTAAQAAKHLGVCVWTVQEWARKGLLPHGREDVRLRQVRRWIAPAALAAFLAACKPGRYPGAGERLAPLLDRRELSQDETAHVLGIDRSSVNYLLLRGRIPHRIGHRTLKAPSGRLVFSLKDLADFTLAERRPRRYDGRDHGLWTPREDACLIAGAAKPRGERNPFWRRTMPDRSLNACKVRLFRLRRRRQYFISPHAVERYWERVDPNARALGDGATIQHILNELQSARTFPSNREQHILTGEQQARLPSLSHWPHRCRTRSLIAVCRTFRAVIAVPAGEDAAAEHPTVATVWLETDEKKLK